MLKIRAFFLKLYESYRKRSPLQKWLLFQKICSYEMEVNALFLLDPNFKLVPRSYFGCFIILDAAITMLYFAYYHRDNFFVAIQPLATFGAVFPVN